MREGPLIITGGVPVIKNSSKRSDSRSWFLVKAAAMSLRKTDYGG